MAQCLHMEALQRAAAVPPGCTEVLAGPRRHENGNKAMDAGQAQDAHILGKGADSKVQEEPMDPSMGRAVGQPFKSGGRQGLV